MFIFGNRRKESKKGNETIPNAGRTQRVYINVLFAYANMAVAILAAFFTTPIILRLIDTKAYGYWLSSGELIGYAATLDLGLLGLFPWLIAEADGKGDLSRIRWLMAHAVAVTKLMSIAAIFLGILGALLLLFVRNIDSETRDSILMPLLLIAALTALNYLLVPCQALLTGMQDVVFIGATSLLKSLLGLILLLIILYEGGGLFALALGTGLPPLIINVLSLGRALYLYGNIFIHWPATSMASGRTLLKESIGPWVAGLGVAMIEKSQSVVLTCLGHPELSVVYAGTAKLTQMLSIVAGLMIESTLVGVAQLSGEDRPARKREVILILLNIQLVLSGFISAIALAINPSFVRLWIGDRFFGGVIFNISLAILILIGSFAYTVIKIAAVQGERLKTGKIALTQGVFHLILTIILGKFFGLTGMATGAIIAVGGITLRQSLQLLERQINLTAWEILKSSVLPWGIRALPTLILSYLVGSYYQLSSYVLLALVSCGISIIYFISVRRCLANVPVPQKFASFHKRFVS